MLLPLWLLHHGQLAAGFSPAEWWIGFACNSTASVSLIVVVIDVTETGSLASGV